MLFSLRCVSALLFITFLMTSSALAEESMCYDNQSYAAEQMVRFQTQLMMIGMVCQRYSDTEEKDTYQKYQIFSKRYEDLIQKYEQNLVTMYKNEGVTKPERMLHNLRTNIANDMSRYAMRMTPERFCDFFENRIEQALAMKQGDLKDLIQQVTEGQVSSRPLCMVPEKSE